MNRIILIGNGFDLAHGMKTSYQNFIEDYWEGITSQLKEIQPNKPFENEDLSIKYSPGGFLTENNYSSLKNVLEEHCNNTEIEYKNKFLEIISGKSSIDKWVDLENEYYSILKKTYREKNEYSIKDLNTHFGEIKIKLGDYLKEVETKFDKNLRTNIRGTKDIIGNKIYHPFKIKDFSETAKNHRAEIEYNLIKNDIESIKKGEITLDDLNYSQRKIIQRINTKNAFKEIKELLLSESAVNFFNLIPNETLFLNFNYTFTDNIYENPKDFYSFYDNKICTKVKAIRIHGTTETRDNNPIIFGFGDELDEDYKLIEKLNDNDYLENVKSINYFKADNYKQLLEFINGSIYQIFIFGHSCGVSDRTMLNTLFEHDNCASIKVFYHQRGENNDNYSDIVRNISRNFNDKAKMRDRVVNKGFCEPLK